MTDREQPGGPKNPQGGPGGGPPLPRRGLFSRNPLLVILLIVAAVLLFAALFKSSNSINIQYSVFRDYLDSMPVLHEELIEGRQKKPDQPGDPAATGEGKAVSNIVIAPGMLRGRLRLPADRSKESLGFEVRDGDIDRRLTPDGYLPFECKRVTPDEDLIRDLRSRGVKFTQEFPTDWGTMWIWALPVLFFVFILVMMLRQSRMTGENVLSFGRSRAKIVGEDKTGVTFMDVAGADEAKEELTEIVEFLKEPERFTSLGGKIPKGVLLMGPPGCGKTLLARAVAGEAGVPFFSISGSDFVEMFVGVGAARVRDLFNTAKQKSPCIIFVDEIDAVGRHRGTGLGGGHDEREQTLNQLLVEMDGFDGRKGVIVVAATNRPDILDPALLRPGRFDRHVVLDAPDLKGREAILKIHARGKPLADDVDLTNVAKRTPGFSGADLENVMNEAALLAARRRRTDISMREVEEAVERVVAGPERRSRMINAREKRILAYHELGHALVARFSPEADPVHKVSIIPRGKGALGYTLTLPNEDRYIITKEELLARIRVTLGGRSAEEIVFNHQSTGAEDDLQKVTRLARSLVCRWGMTEELGPVTYEQSPGSPFLGRDLSHAENLFSEKTSAEIDQAVRQIIDRCHGEAKEILSVNLTLLHKMADHLIEHEVLNLEDFEDAVKKYAETPPPPLRLPHEPEEPTPPANP